MLQALSCPWLFFFVCFVRFLEALCYLSGVRLPPGFVLHAGMWLLFWAAASSLPLSFLLLKKKKNQQKTKKTNSCTQLYLRHFSNTSMLNHSVTLIDLFWTKIPASYGAHWGCQTEGASLSCHTLWWGGPCFGDVADVHLVSTGRKRPGKGIFASSLQELTWPTATKMLGPGL